MSWNTSTPEPIAKDAIVLDDPHLSDVVEAEQREQFEGALKVVEALARVVGRPEDAVLVSISGHANPAHGPRSGWANEFVAITVSAKP